MIILEGEYIDRQRGEVEDKKRWKRQIGLDFHGWCYELFYFPGLMAMVIKLFLEKTVFHTKIRKKYKVSEYVFSNRDSCLLLFLIIFMLSKAGKP